MKTQEKETTRDAEWREMYAKYNRKQLFTEVLRLRDQVEALVVATGKGAKDFQRKCNELYAKQVEFNGLERDYTRMLANAKEMQEQLKDRDAELHKMDVQHTADVLAMNDIRKQVRLTIFRMDRISKKLWKENPVLSYAVRFVLDRLLARTRKIDARQTQDQDR